MLRDIVKNIFGWSTDRKLIIFSVDDYGNVRIGSRKALEIFEKAGLKAESIFNLKDALETTEDLEALFEVLYSVKDQNNRPACFTPYSLTANIDFDKVIESGYQKYFYEPLYVTFHKLKEERTLKLIKQGISEKLFEPQFHGREHLNVRIFEELLQLKDPSLILNIQHHSFDRIGTNNLNTLPYTIAFSEANRHDYTNQIEVLNSGLKLFCDVYGYSATNFMPPSATISPSVINAAFDNGILYLDSGRFRKKSYPSGFINSDYIYLGKKINKDRYYIVRNVVFEPAHYPNFDSVAHAIQQIKTAFLLHKPAIISSHRVNFCGRIDEENRRVSLKKLKKLLEVIKNKWPEAEFITAGELGQLISSSNK